MRRDAWGGRTMGTLLRGISRAFPVAILLPVFALPAEARLWTSVSGRTVEAEFAGMQGGAVVLQAPDGRRFGISMDGLSAADQAFIRSQNPAPMPAPAPVAGPSPASSAPAAAAPSRSPAEILAEIERAGSKNPDWWGAVRMRTPPTLDLTGTYRPKGWEPEKAYGAYFWSIINPNPGRWREGIRLHTEAMDVRRSDPAGLQQCMSSLADAYLRYEKDYARAAYWWNRAIKSGWSPPPGPAAGLAECYFRLGSRSMASDTLRKYDPVCGEAIKLLAAMGDTDPAIRMAGQLAQSQPDAGNVYAGNVCRLAGDLDRAVAYYEKALAAKSGSRRLQQYQQRARDAIQAIDLYDKLDMAGVADGTHQGSCAGYRGPVEVAVKVAGRRIAETRVTNQREDAYFYHLAMPEMADRIAKANTVKGVDTVTGATVTSEAILNAAARALRAGMNAARGP